MTECDLSTVIEERILGAEPHIRLSFASPRATNSVTMLRLETLGGLTLASGREQRPQPRRRLALLARLAANGAHGVSRDELLALLWPECDLASARHSLDQLLYRARRSLGASPTIGTATLCLNADAVACDLAEWNSALKRADFEAAVALYHGPFLQGFYLSGSAEFEQWAESERAALAADFWRALEALATGAARAGKFIEAVRWWRRLATDDRYGSRTALGLMRALADAGDRGRALEFARVHERIVRTELESAPDPAIVAFAESLRTSAPKLANARPTIVVDSSEVREVAGRPDFPIIVDSSRRPQAHLRWSPRAYVATAGLALLALLPGAVALGRRHFNVVVRPPVDTQAAAVSVGNLAARRSSFSAGYETKNIAAHDFYERGRDPTLLRSDSGVRAAIAYLNRAVALDTNYALAYSVLASRYATAAFGITIPISERRAMRARAEAAARRAVVLDGSLADAHVQLGYTLITGYAPVAGAAELERALALAPASSAMPELGESLPLAYEWLERPAAAVEAAQRVQRADPLSARATAELGHALFFARRYDEALTQLTTLAALQPPLRRVPEYMAQVYAATGRWPEVIALLRPLAERAPLYRGLLGYALARSGDRAAAKRLLTSMLADESAGRTPAWAIAELYVGLADYESAFVWLDRSFDDYSLGVVIMGPLFDELRADPRFERVRQRLGLAGRSVARAADK